MAWVIRKGRFVVKGGPDDIRIVAARSALPGPMVISDTLADVVNPVNGKPYDSKSAYYRAVRDAGCSIVGNETMTARDQDTDPLPGIEREIAQALDQHGV